METQTFLPYAQPSISSEDIESVRQSFSTPTITRGAHVEAFEHAIAHYCGASYAVAFSNATAALTAAYQVAQTGPQDRILTTPNSFVASVGPGMQQGAKPIFLDIDRTTGNIDLEQLKLNLNLPATRGKTIIVPVHFSGIPIDMCAIDKSIKNPDTFIIEDAAHAIGSHYKDGTKVGSCMWSHMTVFSFHPAKTLTTAEGGMVTTNDEDLYHRLKRFRNNGIERDQKFLKGQAEPWYYEVIDVTGNFHMTEMQAALGLSQFKRLDDFIAKRQALMDQYQKNLSNVQGVQLFSPSRDLHIAHHLCVAQIDFAAYGTTRSIVMERLKEQRIGTQLHYIPLYRHPFFTRTAGDISEHFPQMEAYYAQALSLPLFYDMSIDDVDHVTHTLKRILAK